MKWIAQNTLEIDDVTRLAKGLVVDGGVDSDWR